MKNPEWQDIENLIYLCAAAEVLFDNTKLRSVTNSGNPDMKQKIESGKNSLSIIRDHFNFPADPCHRKITELKRKYHEKTGN